jgi:cyclophilin family peptidyl-prolyl cis-trans isomerase/protein-disulfide isomerase
MLMISKFFKLSLLVLLTLLTQSVYATKGSENKNASVKTMPEVIFETSMGSFTLELNPEKAPKTVANFMKYIDEGFYNNSLFHRVIPGFVVQGGGFEKGMKKKQTHSPIKNESDNALKNSRGTISMARMRHPDSASSQFFINVRHNPTLDFQDNSPGYTVFGKVTEGMEVIDRIIAVPTTSGRYKNLPKDDVIIISARQKSSKGVKGAENKNEALKQKVFTSGEHYTVLDKPIATRDNNKIEVVEMFSYGCPHCYEFEPLLEHWKEQQAEDVDFWFFPAIWNEPMKVLAHAFYTAQQLNLSKKTHLPLFSALVVEQQKLSKESELADFFANYGVDKKTFTSVFNSNMVKNQTKKAEDLVLNYKPVGVPEIIVNGKYRIDRMRAGGIAEMLEVADYLIKKERATVGALSL